MAGKTEPTDAEQALADALAALLRPLARLAVARGLAYAQVEERLKRAFIEAAKGDEPTAARRVSRIATATGINRREVTRLLAEAPRAAAARSRSIAAEVFAHWTTARGFRDRRGAPRELPRQGAGASFESLAQSVTTDVHPRSILEELVRLGLARHDAERDRVALVRDAYVPSGDAQRMLGFLGDNAGDHLAGAVDNVLSDGRRHFEQAVFADGLSEASMREVRTLVSAQWQALVESLVPALEKMIEHDRAADRPRDRRLRIGLYSYDAAAAPAAPAATPRRRRKDPKP
ncbi:MAG: DUF6502 family protein [Betaproteobacteria bacterium]